MHTSVLLIMLAAISLLLLVSIAVILFRLRRFDLVYIYVSGKSVFRLRIIFPFTGIRNILLHKSEPDDKHDLKEKKVSKFLNEMTDRSGGMLRFIFKLLDSKSSKIYLERVSIESRISTGDNALTGFVCGLAHAAAGAVLSWVVERYGGHVGKVMIDPIYDAKSFDVRIIGIFKTRIIHIIVLIVRYTYRYLKNKIKTGGGYFGTSNRRAYEDGNGEHQGYG